MTDLTADPSTWTAGRDLDAAIAKAMGHELCNNPVCGDNRGIANKSTHKSTPCCLMIPHYSTTWEGMRHLVGHIQNKGMSVRLEITAVGAKAVIYQNVEGGDIVSQLAPELPLAVARVFLYWVGY